MALSTKSMCTEQGKYSPAWILQVDERLSEGLSSECGLNRRYRTPGHNPNVTHM